MDFTISVTGNAPLIMHNARLADPLDEWTRLLARATGKRNKTEEDHREVARLEWAGGLYHDETGGPYIPSANMEATLFRGASKHKLMSALKSALIIPDEINVLAYRGPRTVNELWDSDNYSFRQSVKVGTARVIRTRPIFRDWTCEFTGTLDTDVVDRDAFVMVAETAGKLIGLGDWRPRYGRFTPVVTWL